MEIQKKMSINDKLAFQESRPAVAEEMKVLTRKFGELNPHNTADVVEAHKARCEWEALGLTEAQCKFFGKEAPAVAETYKHRYTFIPGAVVVPVQHTKRVDFAEGDEGLELYEEALKKEQSKTSFKLGAPVIVTSECGKAIFGSTGNVGASLPKDYLKQDLVPATSEQVDTALDSLLNMVAIEGKVGISNLLSLLG
jgi:hypothetical protein